MQDKSYIAIDLKSFYASVECVDRGLDPLGTHLVVADASRTDKTICLAVTPSLKAYGISGRARLFEVVQRVREINAQRRRNAPGRRFRGKSSDARTLEADPSLELDYLVAPPRMSHYMEVSRRVYKTYLRYIAPEDIHVYSVDEVFIDATAYLKGKIRDPHALASLMVRDVLRETGITATAGIGTNLYLAKVAMDIEAKHATPDADGVRIASLDERSYREKYWTWRPMTDFWRIGRGISTRLETEGIYTMGDLARASLGRPWERLNPELLYKIFGVNAELLIDHAWGWEPCTMADIKSARPASNSLSRGQVLSEPYPFEKARLIIREMADLLVMDLVEKGLLTDQMVLDVGYDTENIRSGKAFPGEVALDHYGRAVPAPVHGSANLGRKSSSGALILKAVDELFVRIVQPGLTVRRMSVTANRVTPEAGEGVQLDLFADTEREIRERKAQEAILAIRHKYGKNAILKGMNFEEGATARERNETIGGHKA